MTIRTLHGKFVKECRRLGIQDYEYPFTLKDNGYDALYSYIKVAVASKQSQMILREGKEAQQRFESSGFGESNSLTALNPYGIVQIDGHKIDMLYSIEWENLQCVCSRVYRHAAYEYIARPFGAAGERP